MLQPLHKIDRKMYYMCILTDVTLLQMYFYLLCTALALWLIFYEKVVCHYGLFTVLRKRYMETWNMYIGRILCLIPFVQRLYDDKTNEMLVEFKNKAQNRWKDFGSLTIMLPEVGWDNQAIIDFIDSLDEIVNKKLSNKKLSGAIYTDTPTEIMSISADELDQLDIGQRLNKIYTYAFSKAQHWNQLHNTEFGVGDWLAYQTGRMVAYMFGTYSLDDIMSISTYGGSESLMTACRAYVSYGIQERGHKLGESVIIAPDTIHASVQKAANAYKFRLILIPTDNGKFSLNALHNILWNERARVVAVFISEPSYPLGYTDPFHQIAELITQFKQTTGLFVGLHVDCCLGAWIINYRRGMNFLSYPVVTSLSADNHKFGRAPKGASTLIMRNVDKHNLFYYSIYTVPGWLGGVYGTPKDQGSTSCIPALTSFLAMVTIGNNGYYMMAKSIMNTTLSLNEWIKNECNGLQTIDVPIGVNVVAFRMDPNLHLQRGASYALAHVMQEYGFVLNTIKGDMVQFCITPVVMVQSNFILDFKNALSISVKKVQYMNEIALQEGESFPGDAGMYCNIDAAVSPTRHHGIVNWIQNLFLGTQGAQDAVRMHFLALANPY